MTKSNRALQSRQTAPSLTVGQLVELPKEYRVNFCDASTDRPALYEDDKMGVLEEGDLGLKR